MDNTQTNIHLDIWLEVCIPELVLNETRLEGNSRIGGTGTRLLLYGPVAWENPGNKVKAEAALIQVTDKFSNTLKITLFSKSV